MQRIYRSEKHYQIGWQLLNAYHKKREDHADQEEAQPVQGSCDNVGCRACCLSEEFSGQDVSHTTFKEEETTK